MTVTFEVNLETRSAALVIGAVRLEFDADYLTRLSHKDHGGKYDLVREGDHARARAVALASAEAYHEAIALMPENGAKSPAFVRVGEALRSAGLIP